MKKITTIAAILLASLAAAGTASAQDHAAKANIPFGFYVDSKWVPAGTYIMTSSSTSPDVISIRNDNSSVALLNVGHQVDRKPGANTLVFRKYGDKYFLGEILSANMSVGFNPAKREKAVRTEEASMGTPTEIYLALK